jgi:formylglycine-generating enzyme
VIGGTFSRSYDAVDYLDRSAVATVSDFYLDKYEVTVGRFRAFVDAGWGTRSHPPRADDAAHPRIPGSGWNQEWNTKLPTDSSELRAKLKCIPQQTWTDVVGPHEKLPINCLDWYTAFAFCAWDSGRLPTEAEWNYAASGGAEHRYYPWSQPASSTTIDDSYAVYCGGTCSLQSVGSKSPKGNGKWGQADLGGNVWEWMLDWDPVRYPVPCRDCAAVSDGKYRAFRSGSNDDLAPTLRSATRHVYYPEYRGNIGVRCARNATGSPGAVK